MTKLHNIKGPSGDKNDFRPSTPLLVMCGLFSGIGLAVGFGVGGNGGAPPIVQIAITLSDRLSDVGINGSQGLSSIQLGLWPDWLLNRNEGTRHKSPSASTGGAPVIALVIDDCGADEARTKEAIALPADVTLSFLPYPPAALPLSHQANAAGHEVIVHLPMQPVGAENPGPMALNVGLAPAELKRRVDWALARVSGYDGANNHMGSRFTASRASLIPVMQELSAHGLLFLDSRTTADTEAEKVARDAGLLTGARDVFLDDEVTATAVEHQLDVAEEHARTHGSAIVIGHPHAETLAALKTWVKTVTARGYKLVPLKAVLEMRAAAPTGNTVSALTRVH